MSTYDTFAAGAMTESSQTQRLRQFSAATLVICLLLGYEQNFRSIFFPIVPMAGIGAALAYLALFTRPHISSNNIIAIVLFVGASAYALLAFVIRDGLSASGGAAGDVAKIMAQAVIVTLWAALLDREFVVKVLKYLAIASIPLAGVSVLVMTFNGFLIWDKMAWRGASIFHDPNYAGVYFGASIFVALLAWPRWTWLRAAVIAAGVVGLALSYSKGAILSAALGGSALLWFSNRRAIKALAVASAAILLAAGERVLEFLERDVPLLRLNMGLNQREIVWVEAFEQLTQHPLLGIGSDGIRAIIGESNLLLGSIHNFYIETALLNGIPYTATIIALIAIAAFRAYQSPPIIALVVYFAVAANGFTFSIGSVGLLPVMATLVFLIPYLRTSKAVFD